MEKYCERCQRLYGGPACPECHRDKGRPPRDDDPCFVVHTGQIYSAMICDIYKKNQIPYLAQGSMGAGMAMLTGTQMETYRLYVRCRDYELAKEIADELLAQPEDETEDLYDHYSRNGEKTEELLHDLNEESEAEEEEE